VPGDDVKAARGSCVPAAVLIGLLACPEGPHVILTRRNANLKNHPDEISLPGGRIEADDDGPAAAALRETFEEIGVAPQNVELLGCLSPYETVTGFRVYPFVGWIELPVEFVLDTDEVAEVFHVPLSFVLDTSNHRCESIVYNGECHRYYVMEYPGRRIWGATASILVRFAQALGC
jgi:8-oxo-dGTP pyrophosphatase MutT (NUDIX family)